MSNESGVRALGFRVLVRPDEVEDRTEGGLLLPDDFRERETYAQARGELVSMGHGAFDEVPQDRPQIGDRVIFPKYEGTEIKGADGKIYRLIEDKFIIGVEA